MNGMKANAPITINHTVVKNRLTMAPTVKFDYAGEDAKATQLHIDHYRERAEHGCGLICVEATAVSPEGRLSPDQIGLWNDGQIQGHREIAEACRAYGALVIPQLHYGGLGTHPQCGKKTSPTAITWKNGLGGEETAEELTVPEIRRIVQRDSLTCPILFDDQLFNGKAMKQLGLSFIGDNILYQNGKVTASSLPQNDLIKEIEKL